jgi:hypothetical protein
VFICDHLAFSGEVKINRKHTRYADSDLRSLTARAVGRLGDKFAGLLAMVDRRKSRNLEAKKRPNRWHRHCGQDYVQHERYRDATCRLNRFCCPGKRPLTDLTTLTPTDNRLALSELSELIRSPSPQFRAPL